MSLAGWFRAALGLLEDRSPVAKYPPDGRARAIEFHASLPMALHILCKIYACLRRFGQAALMEESDRDLRALHDRRSPGKQPGDSVFSAAKKMLAGDAACFQAVPRILLRAKKNHWVDHPVVLPMPRRLTGSGCFCSGSFSVAQHTGLRMAVDVFQPLRSTIGDRHLVIKPEFFQASDDLEEGGEDAQVGGM